jgi:hypothetical protein
VVQKPLVLLSSVEPVIELLPTHVDLLEFVVTSRVARAELEVADDRAVFVAANFDGDGGDSACSSGAAGKTAS